MVEEFENGKLLMIEHPEGGIHWFTNYTDAAQFIGCTTTNLRNTAIGLRKSPTCCRWHVSFVTGENVFWTFINPKPDKNPILRKWTNPNKNTL